MLFKLHAVWLEGVERNWVLEPSGPCVGSLPSMICLVRVAIMISAPHLSSFTAYLLFAVAFAYSILRFERACVRMFVAGAMSLKKIWFPQQHREVRGKCKPFWIVPAGSSRTKIIASSVLRVPTGCLRLRCCYASLNQFVNNHRTHSVRLFIFTAST